MERVLLHQDKVDRPLLASHLARLRALRVKLDLLGGQLSTRIHVVTQVDSAKRTLAQELPSPPRHRSAGCWKTTRGRQVGYYGAGQPAPRSALTLVCHGTLLGAEPALSVDQLPAAEALLAAVEGAEGGHQGEKVPLRAADARERSAT